MTALAFSPWFLIPISLTLFMVLSYALLLLARNLNWNANNQPVSLVDLVNQKLPQTQCGQCGFSGCRPYAEAIVKGEAINKCPPGGKFTINSLAKLLNKAAIELDPAQGGYTVPTVVEIREEECIGCTKCIQACPVDAILGAAKLMHSVIRNECTGCDLCIEPCPVDCIDVIPLNSSTPLRWQAPAIISNPDHFIRSGNMT